MKNKLKKIFDIKDWIVTTISLAFSIFLIAFFVFKIQDFSSDILKVSVMFIVYGIISDLVVKFLVSKNLHFLAAIFLTAAILLEIGIIALFFFIIKATIWTSPVGKFVALAFWTSNKRR